MLENRGFSESFDRGSLPKSIRSVGRELVEGDARGWK